MEYEIPHTPGPWRAHIHPPEEDREHYVVAAEWQINICRTGRWDRASAADARLMAAAPELLTAAKDLVLACMRRGYNNEPAFLVDLATLHDAIFKAEGRRDDGI